MNVIQYLSKFENLGIRSNPILDPRETLTLFINELKIEI